MIKFKLSQSKESYNNEKVVKEKEKPNSTTQNQSISITNQLLSYKTTFMK